MTPLTLRLMLLADTILAAMVWIMADQASARPEMTRPDAVLALGKMRGMVRGLDNDRLSW